MLSMEACFPCSTSSFARPDPPLGCRHKASSGLSSFKSLPPPRHLHARVLLHSHAPLPPPAALLNRTAVSRSSHPPMIVGGVCYYYGGPAACIALPPATKVGGKAASLVWRVPGKRARRGPSHWGPDAHGAARPSAAREGSRAQGQPAVPIEPDASQARRAAGAP